LRTAGSVWTGAGLFLFGVLVGAALVYLGLRGGAGAANDAARAQRAAAGILGADGSGAEQRSSARRGRPAGRTGRRGAAGAAGSRPLAGSGVRGLAGGTSGSPAGAAGRDSGRSAGRDPGRTAALDAAGAAAREAAGAAAREAAADAPAGPPPAGTAGGGARVALVIDDLGRSLAEVDALERLGVPLTYAVLPYETQTAEVTAALLRHGEEVLCHLPMEPRAGADPGPGALRLGMSPDEIRRSTLAALRAVPGAVGVNNHMGSGLSADPPSMGAILAVLAAHGLFFLDSRTSAQSVGYQLAAALGVPAAERQVFLDDDPSPRAVRGEFLRLLELARGRGEAIAIGHPHPATLAALAEEVPRAKALGYRFVRVSALLDRPRAASSPPAGGRSAGGRPAPGGAAPDPR
jgi:polysaccharide deacetylase 2 family uncharacterized protein YibQ